MHEAVGAGRNDNVPDKFSGLLPPGCGCDSVAGVHGSLRPLKVSGVPRVEHDGLETRIFLNGP